MRFAKLLSLFLGLFILAGCAATGPRPDFAKLYGPTEIKDRILGREQYRQSVADGKVSFAKDVQPIIESRCVVCHGCYDAPCQLKLESAEGIDRGANKLQVYATRTEATPPTRLGVDAKTPAEWRDKGFYPVLNERQDSPEANLDNSLLAKMLLLKKQHPLPTSGVLPNTFDFTLDRDLQCPKVDEFAEFSQKHPQWGMPYGLPGLTEREHDTVLAWVEQGARYPEPPELPARTRAAVKRFEAFLNGTSLKERLMARYLYEHLFMGHLHFQNHPAREFFRLVRSKTPTGEPVDEIATVRPYDDPGPGPYFYRLRPLQQSIVDKNHMPYEIGESRLKRWRELFLTPDYAVSQWPGYDPELSANPFKVFAAIPPKSRYRFMLDDAYFFISGFMKGPVCRGQVALNVIRDRFWIVFYDPDKDPIGNDPAFLAAQEDKLRLPTEKKSEIGVRELAFSYAGLQKEYLSAKHAYLKNRKDNIRNSLDALWAGDGKNPNAALTTFRHFDSASLSYGFVGNYPLTAWAVDFPLFERIHYLLVAGFNIFGNVNHQAAARLFMDFMRLEGENNFLSLLPAADRRAEYHLWYRGWGAELKSALANPYYGYGKDTAVVYKTKERKKELFDLIQSKLGAVAGPDDTLNRCTTEDCRRAGARGLEVDADRELRALARLRGGGIQYLPELSYLRIREAESNEAAIYSLMKNEAHANVAFMLMEQSRRLPDEDTLTVSPGFIGSYPNFFFDITRDQLPEFVRQVESIAGEKDVTALVDKFGIRRTSPEFWNTADFFTKRHLMASPVAAGIFDLNRYENR